MKLGRLAAKRSLKTPALGNYLQISKLPVPPIKNAWEYAVTAPWQMMKNDQLGDCTCAAAGHMIMNWSANTSTVVTPTDDEIIQAYTAVSGYDPSNGNNDNGAVELDVLNYWKSTGIAGHKILGFATVDIQNIDQVKAAMYLFGGVYTGFNVPQFIMNDTGNHNWTQQSQDTDIIGGHAVPLFGYGRGGATLVSWGELYTLSWQFWQTYFDEAYAIVTSDWIKSTGLSPVGIDVNGLLTDLQAI